MPVSSRLLIVLTAAALTACGGTGERSSLVVFAAASLAGAFDEVGAAFEAAHPDADVHFSFAASSALREQILEGAPADLYASANTANMEMVAAAGATARPPVPFARNAMLIGVPVGNPRGVTGLADFARAELLIGLCAPQVPCGDYARRVLAAAGVEPSIDSEEPTVRSLLTKLETGELDAGLIYRSDGVSSGAIEMIAIPQEWNVDVRYEIAVLAEADRTERAEAFIEFVLSPPGREILVRHGFTAP